MNTKSGLAQARRAPSLELGLIEAKYTYHDLWLCHRLVQSLTKIIYGSDNSVYLNHLLHHSLIPESQKPLDLDARTLIGR